MSSRLPPWARRTCYGAGGALFTAGAFLSGWSLTLLAEQCGIDRPFSLALPLALDAGAAVGVVLWVAGSADLSAVGKRTARLLFGLSVLGNALERLAAFGLLPRPALVVVAVGVAVVFPLLAYRMAHIVLMVRTADDTPSKRPAPRRVETTSTPAAPPATTPTVATPGTPAVETATEWAVGELRAGRTAGWKRIRTQHPALSEHYAQKAAKAARARHDKPALHAVERTA